MITLLLSTALGGSLTAIHQPVACDVSARWSQLDEASLDLAAPVGTTAVPVTMGCRHMGVPGATIDVGGDPATQGLTVVGMRRGAGQVLVAATPDQARLLSRQAVPTASTLVQDGDWRPMIEALERLRR